MDLFNVIISPRAQSDRAECVLFLSRVSVEAAVELTHQMHEQIKSLERYPERNPLFEMPKSFPYLVRKFLINKRYIALYTIEGHNVVIYRILDARRKFDFLVK